MGLQQLSTGTTSPSPLQQLSDGQGLRQNPVDSFSPGIALKPKPANRLIHKKWKRVARISGGGAWSVPSSLLGRLIAGH